MSMQIYHLLSVFCITVNFLFMLPIFYCFIVALRGFKQQKALPRESAKTYFAVLVAARNEAAVIGQLVDSLNAQNYPHELYDIIVAPNNCTDNTREVAFVHGAQIFVPVGPITSKGDVLYQMVQNVLEHNRYDAICVFDADNLVHPDFLQKMNDAAVAGIHVAQCYRDSKNPTDSAMATCTSVGYWIVNQFYNNARERFKLSSLVLGCGFMVSANMLRKLGGWATHSITEDYELTAQCALAGQRVHYVASAVLYDEQPITFGQSWKQRLRWGVGSVQVSRSYLRPLIRNVCQKRDGVCMDLLITMIMPITQPFLLVLGIVSMALFVYGALKLNIIPMIGVLVLVTVGLVLLFFFCVLLSTFVIRFNKGNLRGTGRGVFLFAFFLLMSLPISILSFFKKNIKWETVAHTCAVSINDME